MLAWQIGFGAAMHSAVTLHSTQAPAGPHTGRAAASMAQVCPAAPCCRGRTCWRRRTAWRDRCSGWRRCTPRRCRRVASHTGVGALQVPAGAPAQPTQLLATQKPLPVVVHWLDSRHSTQAPFDPQCFLSPPFVAQMPGAARQSTHMFIPQKRLTGSLQWVSSVQATQRPAAQTGVLPVPMQWSSWLQLPGASGPAISTPPSSTRTGPTSGASPSPPSDASGPSPVAPVPTSRRASPASTRATSTQRLF